MLSILSLELSYSLELESVESSRYSHGEFSKFPLRLLILTPIVSRAWKAFSESSKSIKSSPNSQRVFSIFSGCSLSLSENSESNKSSQCSRYFRLNPPLRESSSPSRDLNTSGRALDAISQTLDAIILTEVFARASIVLRESGVLADNIEISRCFRR